MKEMMQMFALVGAICLWAGAASVATGKSAAGMTLEELSQVKTTEQWTTA